MKELKFNFGAREIFLLILLLIFIVLTTKYFGSDDVGEYSDTGKFFAGKYAAKIRASHSYLFGFAHSPLISLTENFFVYKITSLIFLGLLVLSVYLISNKDKKSFLLMLFSPIVWHMAPWTSPLQLSSLLLLWAYYFIKKYDQTSEIKNLLLSGILLGLGWACWDTMLFFGIFLAAPFIYNKKVSHLFYFLFFVFAGLLPRLLLDYFLFGFPFATILKSFFGTLLNISGGIYNSSYNHTPINIVNIFSLLIFIPIFYWKLYKATNFLQNKKEIIFLTLCIILILLNPQVRYIIAISPIIVLLIAKNLNEKQFRRQLSIFIVITLLVITLYAVQIKYSTNFHDVNAALKNFGKWEIKEESRQEMIEKDLERIVEKYPNEIFLVGNNIDEYAGLARVYWGDDVKEFVSIEDYMLHFKKDATLFEKKIKFVPKIQDRRQIWIGGGLEKNENDATNYTEIKYGIGVGEPLNAEGFELVKSYKILYLSEKAGI